MSKTYTSSHYDDIVQAETTHFWFVARNRTLRQLIQQCIPEENGKKFLEIGFGTGNVLAMLSSMRFELEGIDVNNRAVAIARKRVRAKLYRKSLYTFRKAKYYDAIGIFDVLEHQSDDISFLTASRKLLSRQGLLFLTVPAGQWLWSDLDKDAGHKRRYEPIQMLRILERSGFEPVFWNYWQFTTLPFYLLWRILLRVGRRQTISQFLTKPPRLLNAILFILSDIERRLVFRVRFPLGSSLVVVAKRREKVK